MQRQVAAIAFLAVAILPAQLNERDPAVARECNRVWALIGQRKAADAVRVAKDILGRDRGLAPAYRALVAAYDQSSQWDTAETYLTGLFQVDGNNGLVHFALGHVYAALKQYSKADSHYWTCIQLAPRCWDCYVGLAASYQAEQRLAGAIGDLESLVARDPANPAAYVGLAEAYRSLLRWSDALHTYRAGLPIAERAGDRSLLAEYLRYGSMIVNNSGGNTAESLQFIQRALPLFEQEEDEEQVLSALNTLIGSSRALGHLDAADAYLQKLLARSRKIPNPSWEAAAQKAWGAISVATGNLGEATEHYREAARIFESIDDKAQNDYTLQILGTVFLFQGDYRQAITTYEHAFDVAEKDGFAFHAAYALRLLGNAYGDLGDHWRELDYHIRSTERFKQINLHTAGGGLGSIGSAYFALGDYEKAEYYYKQALESAIKFDDAGEQERHLANLGELYWAEKNYTQAQRHLEKALSFADRVDVARFKAGILITLGELYKEQRKYELALKSCRQGLGIARSIGVKNLEAAALNTLGGILLRSGDSAESQKAFLAALALGETSGLKDIIWTAQKGLGEILAHKNSLDEALSHLELAVQVLDAMRAEIPSPTLRTNFLEDKLELYEDTIDVLFRLHKQRPRSGYDRLAFRYSEQSRAREFLETLAESRTKVWKGLTSEQTEQRASLLREYSQATSRLLQQNSTSSSEGVGKIEEKLDLFMANLRRTNPKYAELVSPAPYTAEQAQAEAVRNGVTLIAYFLGRERSLAWLVGPNVFTMISLPPRAVIENQVRQYRTAITAPPRSERELTTYVQEGQELYQTLLAPMEKLSKTTTDLIIIPDGILYYLPFESLVRPPSSGGHPKFVAEDFTVTYAPSAAVLGYLFREKVSDRPTRAMDLLAYGDPDFGGAQSISSTTTLVRGIYASSGMHFPSLPGTRNEVLSIASFFPTPRRRILLGRDATEGSLKKENLSAYQRIHLATHAVIDERVPARSGVVFSLVNRDGEDGVLQIPEILNLELDADLVVLSACQTGLGRVVRGEGMVGLTRAFFYAGTTRVAVSLWDVNDASTSGFMKAFYRRLRGGAIPSSAINSARLELLNSPVLAYRHPYFWAPFILVGVP